MGQSANGVILLSLVKRSLWREGGKAVNVSTGLLCLFVFILVLFEWQD